METLNSREKIPFAVSEETKRIYEERIIPFWRGKSIRGKIFNEVSVEWKEAYEAGMFTEFQEQRAPGHTVLGDKIYRKGFFDLKKEIREAIDRLDFYRDPEALDKREQLTAMEIAADALISYTKRHVQELKRLAGAEKDAKKKAELETSLKSLKDKEKTLGEDVKALEEEVAIQEIEEQLKAKRAIVKRLESKQRGLKKRLTSPKKKAKEKAPAAEESEEQPEESESSLEWAEAPEPEELPEKPEELAEQLEAQFEEQMKKKKRKWF